MINFKAPLLRPIFLSSMNHSENLSRQRRVMFRFLLKNCEFFLGILKIKT